MDYKYDVFLSYNTSFPYGDWVHEHLLKFLESYLENALNRPAKIFVDRKGISAGDAWPLRLKSALANSRCLVAVLSPSYFNSHWCLAEFAFIIQREKKLDYRTDIRPEGLVVPLVVSDGDSFPEFVKNIECFDCRKFARVGEGFTRTSRYVEFQDKLEEFVQDVANAINNAPQWQEEWLQEEWVDDPISILSPVSTPEFFPSLE